MYTNVKQSLNPLKIVKLMDCSRTLTDSLSRNLSCSWERTFIRLMKWAKYERIKRKLKRIGVVWMMDSAGLIEHDTHGSQLMQVLSDDWISCAVPWFLLFMEKRMWDSFWYVKNVRIFCINAVVTWAENEKQGSFHSRGLRLTICYAFVLVFGLLEMINHCIKHSWASRHG